MLNLYPGSIDSFGLRITVGEKNAAAGQDVQVGYDDVLYALDAIERKLGTDGSSDPASIDYQVGQLQADVASLTETGIGVTATRGALLTGQGGTPTWQLLAIGASGLYLRSDGTDVAWSGILDVDLPATIVRTSRTINTTAPLTGGGTLAGDLTLAMPAASAVANGYLSSADWSTFNAKESALTISTGLTRAVNTITANLSTGLAGGQSVIGGTAASETLTLSSTAHVTKGKILIGAGAYDEASGFFGANTATPLSPIHAVGSGINHILFSNSAANNNFRSAIQCNFNGSVAASNSITFRVCNATATGNVIPLTLGGDNTVSIGSTTRTAMFNVGTSAQFQISSTGIVVAGTWNGTAIGVAYGGTGLTSYAVGDLLYASGATTLAALADVAVGSVLVSGGVGVAPAWSASPSLSSITVATNINNDRVLHCTVTAGGTASARTFTVSIRKMDGSALANKRVVLRWWSSATSYGAPAAAISPVPTITTGNGGTGTGALALTTASNTAVNTVLTDTNGDVVITFTTAYNTTPVTMYFHIETEELVYQASGTINSATSGG